MKFLIFIAILAFHQTWTHYWRWLKDDWFFRLRALIKEKLGSEEEPDIQCFGLTVLLPVLVLALCYYLIQDYWWGIFALVLDLLILVYALGRGHCTELIADFLDHWRKQDYESAHAIAADLFRRQDIDCAKDARNLYKGFSEAVMYQVFERVFAVLFWFLLLGPFGALAYRLSFLYVNGGEERLTFAPARRFLRIIEWLPLQVLGFTFLLVGDFARSFKPWCEKVFSLEEGAQALSCYGFTALGLEKGEYWPQSMNEERFVAWAEKQIRALEALLYRSMVMWVVVVAILALLGVA